MTKTREKWKSLFLSRADFCMVGRRHDIPCFHFLFFLFRNNGKKNTWMTITRHIDNGIWKILYSWRFYGHRSTYMLIFSWIHIMKRKLAKVPWKLSDAQKFEPVLWIALHQDILLIIELFFASQTNLVFKFNLVLKQFPYRYLWILCVKYILEFIQCLYALL